MHVGIGDAIAFRIDKIFLDGEEIFYVMEFDTDEGWLIHVVHDEEGQVVIENREVKTERLTGTVTYTLGETYANLHSNS